MRITVLTLVSLLKISPFKSLKTCDVNNPLLTGKLVIG